MPDTTTDRPAQSGFDWQALEPDIRRHVQDATEHLHALERRTSASIIEIGQTLIDVKARLGHGEFGPWLDAEFSWTDRTARNFMRVAEAFGGKSEILSEVAPTALIALASGNVLAEIREEFIAKAEAGQRVTHKDVREAIDAKYVTVRHIERPETPVTTVRVRRVERPEPEPTVVRIIRPASTDDPAATGADVVREVGHEDAVDDLPDSTPEERQRVVDALAGLFAALHREDGRRVDVHEVGEHLASASREDILQRFFGGDPDRVTETFIDVLNTVRMVCDRAKPTS
jgi:predicted transcriptional regulator